MANVVGAMACLASVTLNISPFQDVLDIHRTRCVTERSILPYCMIMVDGANWVVFAVLIDDAFPIGYTNAFGFLAGTVYTSVYLRHCWNDKRVGVKARAWWTFAGAVAIMLLVVAASIAMAVVWSREASASRIGYVVDLFNIMLYSSPLALAWKVHRTRSTSGMYLPLSITITAAAVLWATYGYLTVDYFVAAPQSVGFLAGVIQLLLFVRYGVADNNEPSLRDPAYCGPNNGGGGNLDISPMDGSLESEGRTTLSDGTTIDGSRASGRGRGQLGQPLITGT